MAENGTAGGSGSSGLTAAGALTVGAFAGALVFGPEGLIPHGGLHARMGFWAASALPVAGAMVVAAGLRQIAGAAGAPALRGTAELSATWLLAALVAAVCLPDRALGVLPVTSLLLLVGRLLAHRGGGREMAGLALGLSVFPAFAMLMLAAVAAIGLPTAPH